MVTLPDVSAVAGHHAMPAALLFVFVILTKKKRKEKKEINNNIPDCFWDCFVSGK